MPGPVPKRSEERRRTNSPEAEKVEVPDEGADAVETLEWPEPDPTWHKIAREWFEALGKSGQRVFYQPSDLARAKYAAHAMSLNLKQGGKMSAVLFAAVNSVAAELLDTEGARRRLRVELERASKEDPEQTAAVSNLDDARARLTGKRAQ